MLLSQLHMVHAFFKMLMLLSFKAFPIKAPHDDVVDPHGIHVVEIELFVGSL